MKYNCNKIEDMLAPYLDNVLEPELKKMVEDHLGECQKCNNLSHDLKQLLSLSGKMDNTPVPAELLNKITVRLENPDFPNRHPLPRWERKRGEGAQNVPVFRLVSIAVIILICGFAGYNFISKQEMKQAHQHQMVAGSVEMPLTEMVTTTALNKTGKSKITEEKEIKEKVIELAKLPEQIKDEEIVFRGGETLKKKKFLLEWKGFSERNENDKYLIVSNQESWKNIWERHLKGIAPEIDFKKDIILAAFSEANELQITEIKESKDMYYIKVKETLGKEEKTETISGNPFHIVVLKK